MPSAKVPRLTGLKKLEGKPLELLLRGQDTGDDPMLILRCTAEGFELHDVVNMIATSELYQQGEMVKRITGKSVRTVRRLLKEGASVRLDTPQSVIAYQYAAALELAIEGLRVANAAGDGEQGAGRGIELGAVGKQGHARIIMQNGKAVQDRIARNVSAANVQQPAQRVGQRYHSRPLPRLPQLPGQPRALVGMGFASQRVGVDKDLAPWRSRLIRPYYINRILRCTRERYT